MKFLATALDSAVGESETRDLSTTLPTSSYERATYSEQGEQCDEAVRDLTMASLNLPAFWSRSES